MRMYPREFPSGRLRKPKRQAERRVYEALAGSDRRGFCYYEWRQGYERIELDFAVWIEGLGRFALQVKGGRYLLIDGEWRLKTRDGVRLVESCPLDDTKLAALDLHDDIEELAKTTYNPYVIPVLAFPDMKPDEAIKNLAKRQGVYAVWGTGHLMADLAEIVHSRTSTSLGCPTTWAQTWPVAGSWPVSRFSMMRICLGGFSLPCRPTSGSGSRRLRADRQAWGWDGRNALASPGAIRGRRLRRRWCRFWWRGFGCWWWRLGCRDGLAGTAGNIEPDVAGGTVKSQAGRDQRFWPGLPQRGAERARRYTVSIESERLCRTGGRHEPRDGDLTVCLKRRFSERDRWHQKQGNHKAMALHRTLAGLDLRENTHQPREPREFTNGGNMTTPNNDHLTALETYESVRDFFEPHLQRQWDKVLRSARRSAFAAAYDAIVNADQWPDGADALSEAYWATMEVYEATLGVLGDFTPDYPVDGP